MTRLITEWLDVDRDEIEAYGASVKALTGVRPLQLAMRAAARMDRLGNHKSSQDSIKDSICDDAAEDDSFHVDLENARVAVVRITSGLGVIDGFADSLCALLSWLGADVIMPSEADVNGIYHAAAAGADIIFLADDDRFLCLNLRTGVMAENNEATAYGYAEALNLMAGGIAGEDVLLLGFGPVGRCALQALKRLGATVVVHDKDHDKQQEAASLSNAVCDRDEIGRYRFILDATNEGKWLSSGDLHPKAQISAPGLPLSLDDDTRGIYKGKIFSDVLQTGATVMLCRALMKK
jgi:pyrrolysine biosynthesis protein PylD